MCFRYKYLKPVNTYQASSIQSGKLFMVCGLRLKVISDLEGFFSGKLFVVYGLWFIVKRGWKVSLEGSSFHLRDLIADNNIQEEFISST